MNLLTVKRYFSRLFENISKWKKELGAQVEKTISPQLNKTELQELAELREIYLTTGTPGWHRLQDLMQGFVDEAHEDMVGAKPETSDAQLGQLTRRWQQREAMLRGVLDYIAECDRERKRILAEIAEREKERTEYGIPIRSQEESRW